MSNNALHLYNFFMIYGLSILKHMFLIMYIYIYIYIPVIAHILQNIPRGCKNIARTSLWVWWQYFFHPRATFYNYDNNWFIIWVWDVIKRRTYRVQNNFLDQSPQKFSASGNNFQNIARRAIYTLNIVKCSPGKLILKDYKIFLLI